MATRNVVLTDSQSKLIDNLIESGRFQNANEVLRAGIRLLEREEAELAALYRRLEIGVNQALSGSLLLAPALMPFIAHLLQRRNLASEWQSCGS